MMWASILDQRAFKKELDRKRNRKNLMAIARLSVKVGKAGKAAPHAEYIDRDEEKSLNRNRQKPTLNIVLMETCRNGLNIIPLPLGGSRPLRA